MHHPLFNNNRIYPEACKEYHFNAPILSLKTLNLVISSHSYEWFVKAFASIYSGKECLNTESIGSKFTPLHFCAIADNLDAAEQLLEAGADPNRQDSRGWTPLHHAALASHHAMIELLLRHRADPSIQNCLGGTYQNILNLLDPPQDLAHLRWIDEKQQFQPMTAEHFSTLTNAQYVSNCKIDREQLWHQMQDRSTPNYSFFKEIKQQEQHVKKSLLALGYVSRDSEGKLLKMRCGIGLFAAEVIPVRTIIGEYCGQIESSPKQNPYLLRNINAQPMRNETAHINDGFPNCICVDIGPSQGLSKRYLMVAAKTLAVGEQILWNYGYHKVKTSFYIELAKKECRLFSETMRVETYLHLCFALSHFNSSFESYVEAEKYRYILHTPSILFIQGIERSVDRKIIKKLLRIGCDELVIPSEHHEFTRKIPKAVKRAHRDLQAMQQDYPLTHAAYRHLLLNRMMEKGIAAVVKTALEFGAQLQSNFNERAQVRAKEITDAATAQFITYTEL